MTPEAYRLAAARVAHAYLQRQYLMLRETIVRAWLDSNPNHPVAHTVYGYFSEYHGSRDIDALTMAEMYVERNLGIDA